MRLSLEDCRVVKREAARVAKLMDGRLLDGLDGASCGSESGCAGD